MDKKNIIKIRGARVNNLKNIDLDIQINKITCFMGPSGSGKTSLAFHTLYSESKRRFLNSFPTYLKFFSERPTPVDVDSISPVLPVFALPQINPIVGSRSVALDVMGITPLVATLYEHFGFELCPVHKEFLVLSPFSDYLKKMDDSSVYYLFVKKEDYLKIYKNGQFPNRSMGSIKKPKVEDFKEEHDLYELIRFKKSHLEKVDKLLRKTSEDISHYYLFRDNILEKIDYTPALKCPHCDYISTKDPHHTHLSPYNALGACKVCNGFGATLEYDESKLLDFDKSIEEGGLKLLEYNRFADTLKLFKKICKEEGIDTNVPLKDLDFSFFEILNNGIGKYPGYKGLLDYLETKKYKRPVRIFLRLIQKEVPCESCFGTRVDQKFHHISISRELPSYKEFFELNLQTIYKAMNEFPLNNHLFKKIKAILEVACAIGLGHLKALRKTKSLSAGEFQRLLLIKYLSYEGSESLFIFDEPSLGLSQDECFTVIKALKNLIMQGNTVLLVDHSEIFQKASDEVILMGPGAGDQGGEIIYQGKYKEEFNLNKNSLPLTKTYLKNHSEIKIIKPQIHGNSYQDKILIKNGINLFSGASGSGKSSVAIDILANAIFIQNKIEPMSAYESSYEISGIHDIKDALVVNSELNRYTSRSSVGSITELSSVLRKHYLKTKGALALHLKDGHFSSNSDLGKCQECDGKGFNIIEMQFLEDIVLTCDSCKGKKIKPLYANIDDGVSTIYEALNTPISSLMKRIDLTPKFVRVLEIMKILNLDYLSLDRGINSLSGGEKQRIFLLSKMVKKIENTLIVLENISFGLSSKEIDNLILLFNKLIQSNNTLVIIDPHPLFKKFAHQEIFFP